MFPRASEHRESASEGRQIGPYRTYATLPGCGFGVEYLASRVDGERSAAGVRMLALEGIAPAQRKRLKRRLEEARRLSHRNLESVIDVIDDRKTLVAVTERVFGVTLHDLLLRASEPLDKELVAAIVAQVAFGLQALHDHVDRRQRALDWVHGHLSPRTILLSWSGRVVLAKVGFGELVTRTSDFAYFSPEQARSAPVDRRSDVFALGSILYEGLTGSKPFSHRSLPDYMLSVLADHPRDPRELRPSLSPELGRIAMRCLEREPERRFPNAQGLAEALQTCTGVDFAAAEHRLPALMAEHFPQERSREVEFDQYLEPAELSLERDPPAGAAGRGKWRLRPVFLLLIVAIALVIVAWAGVSRGA